MGIRTFIALSILGLSGSPASAETIANPVVHEAALGEFRHGTFPSLGDATHPGVDLVAACGTYVWAFADGKVADRIASPDDPNFDALGYMIIVEHPASLTGKSFYTLYLHLQEPPEPEKGAEVYGGQSFLGKVGKTGRTTGCHTHFEIRYFPGRFSAWNNVYGPGDQRNDEYFQRNWEDPAAWFARFPGGLRQASGRFGSMLIAAVEAGRVDDVRELLAREADPNAADAERHTALMKACRKGFPEMARLLLEKGAKVNAVSEPIGDSLGQGDTPLLAAVHSKNPSLVKLLLDAGANPKGPTAYGSTLVAEALWSENQEVADLLLAAGADLKQDETTLVAAAGGGHLSIVKLLLQAGVDVNAGAGYGKSLTALMAAAGEGHAPVVKLLLASRAKVDLEGASGLTALGIAAEEGHTEIVRILLAAGAGVEGCGDPYASTALGAAAEKGHVEIVKLLLAHGAKTGKEYDGKTPLARAAEAGHTEVVRLLREAGAKR